MRNLTIKNTQTGRPETIKVDNFYKDESHFSFTTENELMAYKAAYVYRDTGRKVVVEYAPNVQAWLVTVSK